MTVYSKQGTIVNWAGRGCAGGLSMRAVQQQVFGYMGGKAYDAVKPIYEEVKALRGGITGG